MELLFQFLCFAPGPFWLLIIALPKNRNAMLAVDAFLLVLCVLFVVQTVPVLPQLLPLLAKPEFESIRSFLTTKQGFVASWNHMVLGDLWIGRWIAQDTENDTRPLITRLVFIPIVLFFGPLGLFAYLAFRCVRRRQFSLTDPEPLASS